MTPHKLSQTDSSVKYYFNGVLIHQLTCAEFLSVPPRDAKIFSVILKTLLMYGIVLLTKENGPTSHLYIIWSILFPLKILFSSLEPPLSTSLIFLSKLIVCFNFRSNQLNQRRGVCINQSECRICHCWPIRGLEFA